MMPSDNEQSKVRDRISFRLYACGEHLKNLVNIQLRYGKLNSTTARISAEMEIDAFLSQIIGTIDSLLFRVNEAFLLGIPIDRIEIDKVQSGLSAQTKKIDLLAELDQASQHGNWYWLIKQLRNYSLGEFLVSGQPLLLSNNLKIDNVKLVTYFEQCLGQLKKLIEGIKLREPLLLP
jgi:hypothetical protein